MAKVSSWRPVFIRSLWGPGDVRERKPPSLSSVRQQEACSLFSRANRELGEGATSFSFTAESIRKGSSRDQFFTFPLMKLSSFPSHAISWAVFTWDKGLGFCTPQQTKNTCNVSL